MGLRGAVSGFGPEYKTKHFLVKTPEELDGVLGNKEFNEAKYAQVTFQFFIFLLLLEWLSSV